MANARAPRHLLVLGGSLSHRGGLESFCARATQAVTRHAEGWQASWSTTDTAYLAPRRLGDAVRAWRRLSRIQPGEVDLVWLQWSTLADLLFLRRVRALGLPVLVTPHLGANARLQRVPLLRAAARRLLAGADRLGLLFPGQEAEIALPQDVPRDVIGSFLPEIALAAQPAKALGGPLRLIHAGRLGHGKGSFRMIALCAALRARGIALAARIVGSAEPALMAELAQAIAAAGLTESLELTGWMDEAALIAALGAADVLVHLSELDSFPLIVLEALAAGTLPIVADMAGARALVERYGGLVAAGVDQAADWLAAQDPADLRRAAANIAAPVRRDEAWASAAARVIAAAEATLAGPGHGG